ncbi:disease resistance protein [Marchantia polymorpha subsp. ruderalis]|uniref:CHORD domain-containing protein n=2 Tax=Marchantia polymorpha TaxID=3197 RepID=A0A176W9T2_MARPO|nr:hypothetical protein AXG93_4548s1210 [Marchantia polymorpha subsp. ruderalis]PTQ44397.1 hypothetical protein MARPO_0020s0061 [Marchantia polymorpha]BBN09822.1 hypothetical protein Mp_4g22990 [Marchantia polymorpha subsp. ruderalis]|eukprot:PTQ44397.1 hypothetical protein MARPO_0020s0061 [Marchantia polymorpha]
MTTVTKQKCQRIGCDVMFTADDNPEGSCRYHPGPLFHDGGKEWSCCKQRSHDFSLFLELPGCKTGQHTSEKPLPKIAPSPNKPVPVNVTSDAAASANCNRCRQGFYCSDHGSRLPVRVSAPAPKVTPLAAVEKKVNVPAPRKIVDLNAKQTCKNKGCGKEFTEKENTDTACSFHPGPAIFHDRSKGWKCCDTHVKEFEEFLEIPPCAKGWHNANPDEV